MKGAWGDHPRIRGKHKNYNKKIIEVRGSPPHTRETLKSTNSSFRYPGITPAYAGNTTLLPYTCKLNQDHPRIRGKHYCLTMFFICGIGSPPHTRETQIKDPVKSTFFTKQISKNIHFLREFKDQLSILKCPVWNSLIDPI